MLSSSSFEKALRGSYRSSTTPTEACQGTHRVSVFGSHWYVLTRSLDGEGGSVTDVSRQVLPIDDYEKAKLLPIKSVRLRMKLVAHWIDQLNSTW